MIFKYIDDKPFEVIFIPDTKRTAIKRLSYENNTKILSNEI